VAGQALVCKRSHRPRAPRCRERRSSYTCGMNLARMKQLSPALLLLVFACDSDLYVDTSACRDQNADTACPLESGQDVARPSYFVNGDSNPELLRQIQLSVEEEIGFAEHYSMAYVGCGTGCGSYWFVDRRSGAVMQGPADPSEEQMIWDLKTNPESDVVEVIYGPRDGIPSAACSAQSFVRANEKFEASSPPTQVACPN
jgi:hypothetical protein